MTTIFDTLNKLCIVSMICLQYVPGWQGDSVVIKPLSISGNI